MKLRDSDNQQRILNSLEYHFIKQAEKISTKCSENQSRYLRQGVDSQFKLTKITKDGFLTLCCIQWYLPEELGISLRMYLWERRNYFGPDYYQKISLLLESKAKMLIYILESNVLGQNPDEVFGKITANRIGVKVQQVIKNKPKRIQRHRGYRDKGSRRLGFEFLSEQEKDSTLRELQLRIEEFRESQEHSYLFWSGFLD